MEDIIYYNDLYDLYGELLTEKQRKYFEDYYFNNLSFSEMADKYDVSRNAAFKQTRIVTQKLEEYERILKLKEKKEMVYKLLEDVSDDIRKKIEEII